MAMGNSLLWSTFEIYKGFQFGVCVQSLVLTYPTTHIRD